MSVGGEAAMPPHPRPPVVAQVAVRPIRHVRQAAGTLSGNSATLHFRLTGGRLRGQYAPSRYAELRLTDRLARPRPPGCSASVLAAAPSVPPLCDIYLTAVEY